MLHAAQVESVLSSLRPRSQEIVVISFTRHQKNRFKIEGLIVSTTPEPNVKQKKKDAVNCRHGVSGIRTPSHLLVKISSTNWFFIQYEHDYKVQQLCILGSRKCVPVS